MGLNEAIEISVSGIDAQRTAMELIASNLANISTTRTVFGLPYRRRVAVFSERPLSFEEELYKAQLKVSGGGVVVSNIAEDKSPFQKVYNPGHPDADSQGFVQMPNVNLSNEMVDLIYTSRLYEANITAFNATKKMMQDTLQLQ